MLQGVCETREWLEEQGWAIIGSVPPASAAAAPHAAVASHADKYAVGRAGAIAAQSLQALAAHAEGNWAQLDPDEPGTQLQCIQTLAEKDIPEATSSLQPEAIHMIAEPQRRFLSQACARV